MKKKERRLCRMLDRMTGLEVGSHERIARSSALRKTAILAKARKELKIK